VLFRSLAPAPPALPLPRRVRELLERRLRGLSAAAREVVEVVAVLGSPASPGLLLALAEGLDEAGLWRACREALATELLGEDEAGVQCRHDLIRSAALAAIGPTRRCWLHRRTALALGAQPQAEPLAVAAHWEAAQEPQTALAWVQRGALRQKERGRFEEAVALWQRVAEESLDATQVLRARLALAECDLLRDLARGRAALQQVLDELGAVADPLQRDQIEAQALAGLVDNAVFSGHVPQAQALAPRLRELLPRVPPEERVHACEVLIELAMREPDIDGARALLAQVQRLAPRRPSTLSFAAQIHWFGGDPRAARDAFEALLARHPDYCSGLTIENDLAVMLLALGELTRAETMARRSLASWQGVEHTETLSLLVLGSVLTSAGRHAEAHAALDRALALGRAQSSALFEAEALVRRARLWLQCGRAAAALDDLAPAGTLLADSSDPLRVSQYALHTVLAQLAAGRAPDRTLSDRLRTISLRSAHPLLHARMARIEVALALADGETLRARAAAARQAEICRAAGLLEPLAEALLLQAQALAAAARSPGQALPADDALALVHEAAALADAQGFADLAWRAHAWLATALRSPAQQRAAREARQRLVGEGDAGFDAAAAARRPPWFPA
jgi:tetratricopeptide (TPR) repeat protein